jgi:hypothetical protein
MAKPTMQDAEIMLRLAQLHALQGVRQAAGWMWSDQFTEDYKEFDAKYPEGTEEKGYVYTVATFNETVGTLWKHGLINEDLLFDWLAIDRVWDRIKGFCLGERQEHGEPRLWENFEAMANAARSWSQPARRSTRQRATRRKPARRR